VTAEINVQDHAFERVSVDLVEAHDELLRGRDALVTAAQDLVADGWRGVAADQYADAWDEWAAGADRVLRSLLDLTGAMRYAHGELSSADDDAGSTTTRLRSRLAGGS
jgi:uncharacterized protein YukE